MGTATASAIMPSDHEVSHGDILRAIGNIEGKLDAIHQSMANNRADIVEAFRRLNEAERRIAQGVILAVVASLVMPVVVMMASPRVEFGPAPQHRHDRQP
jgi:hypothetical protein